MDNELNTNVEQKAVPNPANEQKGYYGIFENKGTEVDYSLNGVYQPSINRLRLSLMFFMCIYLCGFPTVIGGVVQKICGFVPIAFFILSGYLVLQQDENRSKRIGRAIRRTAIVFAVLAVVYFAMSLLYYKLQGINIFPYFRSKRLWFNFLVLNKWPFSVGDAIWYVQSLLYAYIIIYFLEKLKLLRFDWIIAAVLIVLTICTGELSGILKWNILGYTYLPGNFLTRALPYVLLGGFIQRNMKKFGRVSRATYRVGIVVGLILTVAEIVVLGLLGKAGYYGHLIGMPIIAVSVCILAFQNQGESKLDKTLKMSRQHINCIYYFCQPVSFLMAVALSVFDGIVIANLIGYIGIFVFVICFIFAWIISYIGNSMRSVQNTNETNETNEKDH